MLGKQLQNPTKKPHAPRGAPFFFFFIPERNPNLTKICWVNVQNRSDSLDQHFLVRLGLRSGIKKKRKGPHGAWGFVNVYLTLSNPNLTKKCR